MIGCPGSGKSTFSRKLSAKTGLPLHYLDMIWHRPDRTIIEREEFDMKLREIVAEGEWILDGNYVRTLPMRLSYCDTVFFFDLPLEVCIEGIKSRLGKEREDMPWHDDELDPEFLQWVEDFPDYVVPVIDFYLDGFEGTVVRFRSRSDADAFIDKLN